MELVGCHFLILELPSWPRLYWPSRRIFQSEIWFSFLIWSWSTNKEIFSERVQKRLKTLLRLFRITFTLDFMDDVNVTVILETVER